MKAIIFGATGMVGQGVMRECLNDARVGQAMINVAEKGYDKPVLEVADLKKVSGG